MPENPAAAASSCAKTSMSRSTRSEARSRCRRSSRWTRAAPHRDRRRTSGRPRGAACFSRAAPGGRCRRDRPPSTQPRRRRAAQVWRRSRPSRTAPLPLSAALEAHRCLLLRGSRATCSTFSRELRPASEAGRAAAAAAHRPPRPERARPRRCRRSCALARIASLGALREVRQRASSEPPRAIAAAARCRRRPRVIGTTTPRARRRLAFTVVDEPDVPPNRARGRISGRARGRRGGSARLPPLSAAAPDVAAPDLPSECRVALILGATGAGAPPAAALAAPRRHPPRRRGAARDDARSS